MPSRRFKNPIQQKHYDAMRLLARDLTSELFHDGRPRLGSGARTAYWKGRDGKPSVFIKQSAAYACWAAGVDDRKDLGPPPHPIQYLYLSRPMPATPSQE